MYVAGDNAQWNFEEQKRETGKPDIIFRQNMSQHIKFHIFLALISSYVFSSFLFAVKCLLYRKQRGGQLAFRICEIIHVKSEIKI